MSKGTYKPRNYSLTGPENRLAKERGLAEAEWYRSPISRKRLKELMQRKDGPAIRDTLLWFALLIGTGTVAYLSWGTWWAIPAFAIYGMIYMITADSRWHECGHGTAFKTEWMNQFVYHIASFMDLRQPTPWRWSHHRHHTDTYIVGRDPELSSKRPPKWRRYFFSIFNVYHAPMDLRRVVLHSFGKLEEAEKDFVPATESSKIFWIARIWAILIVGLIVWCISIQSILPLMFVVLPTFYGPFLLILIGVAQHAGLYDDVLDHRLNSRTIYLNPFFRFLYWNMNYHIEHHMYPLVPYHALPALHNELKQDMPAPNPNLWSSIKEIYTVVNKQRKDPTFSYLRPLPATANPYYFGPAHQQVKPPEYP
jgi:fatty acid desaturase